MASRNNKFFRGRRNWNGLVRRVLSGTLIVVVFASAANAERAKKQQQDATDSTVARLLEDSRLARIEGNATRSFASLRDAARIAPEDSLVRWQLGQIQVNGQWLAVEEAERRAASDPRQAQYRELRKQYGETPEGQLALARWCRKQDLDDEARFHWASVLAVDPSNEEALRAVDMRWRNGSLLTPEQLAEQKRQLQEARRASKIWTPKVSKWRRAVSGEDESARKYALTEIRAIRQVNSIFTLEEVTLGKDANDERHADECSKIADAFVEALSEIPDQKATESLTRHAVFAPSVKVRVAATEELGSRPQHDYVPMLLDALAMPIESSFSVMAGPDGSVHYTHSLYREGKDSDLSINANYSTRQYVLPGRDLQYRFRLKVWEDRTPSPAARAADIAMVARQSQSRYAQTAATVESQVRNENQTTKALSTSIMEVLRATTKNSFPTPQQWWSWWQDNNEYYAYDHPVEEKYYSDTDNYFYGHLDDKITFNHSCFVKGTPVWTKTGQRSIETLELGDLVLAQDVDTGELVYKPVVGRTVRPPSEILKVSFDGETVRMTKGHPVWVAGIGWRMAKELGEDAVLHSVTGAPRVKSVESDGEAEAYNLVVADLNTYFVGECGILVHDNLPRRPTHAVVPGLAAK